MYIAAETLDDLLRAVFSKLLKSRSRIRPTRGAANELIGVLLHLTNPRARLSRTETKGRLFSCVGELLWYLARTNDVEFISYYLPRYRKESDDGRTVYGGYGPRLFNMRRQNQIANVLRLLKKNRHSRRAVIQLFDAVDLVGQHKDIPCTCTLQFLIRGRRLHLVTNMRSNDAFLGLPHDVFAFTMLQEILARTLGVEPGTYVHAVGSLHLYRRHRDGARQFLREGWQSTLPMPHMPRANPWRSLDRVLRAERAIRCGRKDVGDGVRLANYWADLVRLLQIYRHFKRGEASEIARLKDRMTVRLYDSYIEGKKLTARRRTVRAKRCWA